MECYPVAKVGGLAIAGGLAAGVAGLVALTGKAVMAQAELEQQIGGSEAVFGQYAKTIQEKAAGAFKTAGLSAGSSTHVLYSAGSQSD